jgi:short subunit dehydrogenase-like uncharacterized protein
MERELLVYGANGYTGRLVAQQCLAAGLRPVLAGRDAAAVTALARELSLPHRAFPLQPAALDAGLDGVAVVLHCAGPFEDTALPMARACLRAGAHYLDITGELAVFEALRAFGDEARAAGVMLLPGAGLDVVPSDCLAAELAARVPGATRLELALLPLGGLSRGTALTMLRVAPRGGAECRGGAIVRTRAARVRAVDFGRGPVRCLGLPWGDACTAHVSTGIPEIVTWVAVPPRLALAARLAGPLRGLIGSRLVQRAGERAIRRRPPGPTAEERARGRCLFWGRASDAAGRAAEGRLATPEGYTFTSHSAVALARVALQGGARPGFQTPSRLCGARFVLSLPGVTTGEPWVSAGC